MRSLILRIVYGLFAIMCMLSVIFAYCRIYKAEKATQADHMAAEFEDECHGSFGCPEIYWGDFDEDGMNEYALVETVSTGTGVYEQQLYILEKLDQLSIEVDEKYGPGSVIIFRMPSEPSQT